ncbi:tetratricopeptide repeat protein [bacterium]|nr:tetratricopeptide repeat protein [bacterium]
MPYDIFVSYSRRDNNRGQVSQLIGQIRDDCEQLTGDELRCFFDLEEIRSMDDWRHRILGGLRESKIFLLILSPAYLASDYCQWEIVEFLKYEHSRAVQGQGVAQIYFVEIPDLDSPDSQQEATEWLAGVRRRNHIDLRPWYNDGAAALAQDDVRERLADLERSISHRLTRLKRIVNAPGNLPAHNPRFVGRETEMERLHRAAGLGQYGILTAVQGVGGLGKTALAIQYAYAYADFYPGGRWMIGCAGRDDLAGAIRSLDVDLGVQFTDDEKTDDTRAARRILANMRERAEKGAAERAAEPNPPSARALIILDNVDAPDMLRPPQIDLVSGQNWLHVIATTRLDPGETGWDTDRHTHVPVDELPDDDALRLIESHQPDGRFQSETERDAAREIVGLLGGFTLAVEVVAVHLGERHGRLRCADLLTRLRRDGVDAIAKETRRSVNHVERLMSVTLAPTLELLSEPELEVLTTASLCPPDSVVLPWLRAVVAERYPELGRDAEPGYDDPWSSLVNHLIGLRLLQVIDWADDTITPRICRMHRVVLSAVRQRAQEEMTERRDSLLRVALDRAGFLKREWLEWTNRWEIEPLAQFAEHLSEVDSEDACRINRLAALCLDKIGLHRAAVPILRMVLESREQSLGSDHPDTLSIVNDLAAQLEKSGDYTSAEPLLRRALAARERLFGPYHRDTLTTVNNLAFLLQIKCDFPSAELLYRRALAGREQSLGIDDPDTLTSLNNLGTLLVSKGDLISAEPLLCQALNGRERTLGPEHPETLVVANNLAALFRRRGDLESAEALYRRAFEGSERALGSDHPMTLSKASNLALLLERKGDHKAAASLRQLALKASERVLGPDHPDTLTCVNCLADSLKNEGDVESALTLSWRVLRGRERVLGPDHPHTLDSASAVALLLQRKGSYDQSEDLNRRALEGRERVLGRDHPDTLTSVNNLAYVLQCKRHYDAAELLLRRGLADSERVLGPDHAHTLTFVHNLAHMLQSKGVYGLAESLYRRAAEGRGRVLGVDHPDTLTSVHNLAHVLQYRGELDSAEPLYRRALEGNERVLGPDHPDTHTVAQNFAGLLEKMGRHAESTELRRKRIAILAAKPETPPLTLRHLALDSYKVEDYETAEGLLVRVLNADFEVPGTRCHLARVCLINNNDTEAALHAEEAWRRVAEAPPYIVGRILWFKTLFALLNSAPSDPFVGRLKMVMQSDDAHLGWDMARVLEHLKPRLPADQHAFLAALIAALSDQANGGALDQFEWWRNAIPQPIT